MPFQNRADGKQLLKSSLGAIVLTVLMGAVASSLAQAEAPFDGPKFKRGLWRFDRTLEYPDGVKRGEVTRCVDPTVAMKGTFASPDVGNCRSARAQRVDNRYTFENRCDYMGPVRTAIIVHSDEAYTELNVPKANKFSPVDKVVARRVGDCESAEVR